MGVSPPTGIGASMAERWGGGCVVVRLSGGTVGVLIMLVSVCASLEFTCASVTVTVSVLLSC